MSLPFQLKSRSADEPVPEWDGVTFRIGAHTARVYAYDVGQSGWNQELTELHEQESEGGSHFIDVASRKRALSALSATVSSDRPVLLEVGVSSGHFLRDLKRVYPSATIVGADYTLHTLQAISGVFPDVPFFQIDLTRENLPSNAFDAIIILNVLEHIEDDAAAVRNCLRMLKPGGALIVEVPAGPHLYDNYDRELMHFRRYDAAGLSSVLKGAGFTIERLSHIGFLLYPAFAFAKKKAVANTKDDQKSVVRSQIKATARFNAVGHALMTLEGMLNKIAALPIGIRCAAVARKPR